MKKVLSGAAVPRHSVFTLTDGAFVIQWDEAQVQDLLSGDYRPFRYEDIGHPVTDYELNQLKSAGRVEHFNRAYVWLYALPETGRHSYLQVLQRGRELVRMYYLNTTLLAGDLPQVQQALADSGVFANYTPYLRGERVVLSGKDGALFASLEDVENAQKQLHAVAPALGDLMVAFIEVKQQLVSGEHEILPANHDDDLATIIASQTDTSVTRGRQVVVVGGELDSLRAIVSLCQDMEMRVHPVESGVDALRALEDDLPDLLVMDMQLPDMHGWELLAKLREIVDFSRFRVVVIAPASSGQNEQTLALGVAKVDVYLVKPVSLARLRQNIWMVLKDQPPN
ncbi:MAG: response regulator [Anaerolineaceae bacterium]|nr:response regulator [Anaerolineaceae bacterium]